FSKKLFFGFKKLKTNDGFMFLVEDEKLIIDALLFPKNMGNFDEIIKMIIASKINISKLINYLNILNNKSLNKKIGFLLEKYKKIDISKKIVFKDKNYVYLGLQNKIINTKWMVKHDFT